MNIQFLCQKYPKHVDFWKKKKLKNSPKFFPPTSAKQIPHPTGALEKKIEKFYIYIYIYTERERDLFIYIYIYEFRIILLKNIKNIQENILIWPHKGPPPWGPFSGKDNSRLSREKIFRLHKAGGPMGPQIYDL